MLRGIFGPKIKQVIRVWRKVHKELFDFYASRQKYEIGRACDEN